MLVEIVFSGKYMKLTEAQNTAVYQRDSDMLVSAGAGSGKTSVLSKRIAALIAEGRMDADSFIAVTFTRAAAGKLKSKIRAELTALCADAEGENRDRLTRELAKLEMSMISTIDALCKRITERYYYISGTDPLFSIADEEETAVLKSLAAEALAEEMYETENEAYMKLDDAYGEGYDSSLTDIIVNLYDFLQNKPDGAAWLDEKCAEFYLDADAFTHTEVMRVFKKYMHVMLGEAERLIDDAARLSADDHERCGYFAHYRTECGALGRLLEDDTAAFFTRAAALKLEKMKFSKRPKNSSQITARRDSFFAVFERVKKATAFDYTTNIRMIHATAPYMKTLCAAVKRFGERYDEIKKERRLADFSDVAHWCLNILKDDTAAGELRAQYQYIFLDEYQDTNSLQEAIIARIKTDGHLFCVGDVKQSIYRFRHAEPEIFIRRYEAYAAGAGKRVLMKENFRSSAALVGAVNSVFERIMTKTLAEIDYYPNETLVAMSELPAGRQAELHIVVHEKTNGETEQTKRRTEAVYTAALVREILASYVIDEETHLSRRIHPDEIAIIGRNMKNVAPAYIEALKECGIGVNFRERLSYFDAVEVRLIIDLLKLIDNEKDDIALLGVMRSFIFAFNEDELTEIRAHTPEGAYSRAAHRYRQSGADEKIRKKLAYMYERIQCFRATAQRVSLEKLLSLIYADTRILMFVSALPDGVIRRENLTELAGRAAAYEKGSYKGLYSFILYLEKCMKHARQRDKDKSAAAGCINMMTAHAAKGLEFTAVICVECAAPLSKRPERNAAKQKISVFGHKDVGVCPVYVSENLDCKCDTLYVKTAEILKQAENYAEEMRILYVAATRAKQMLYFTACVTQSALDKLTDADCDLLTGSAQTPSYLKWLYSGIAPAQPGMIACASGYVTNEWIVKSVKGAQTQPEAAHAETAPHAAAPEDDKGTTAERLHERLSVRYACAADALIPAKVTVTQLKDSELLAYRQRVISLRDAPDFTGKKSSLSAAAAGTALHTFMQHLDEKRLARGIPLAFLAEEMAKNGILTEQEAAAVDLGAVTRFFESGLGKELLRAETVRKELPFLMRITPGRIDAQWSESKRTVLLQGVIDCVFESDKKTYLIDYKTDGFVSEEAYACSCEKYARQLLLYADALKRIEGRAPDEAHIVFIMQDRTTKVL